MYHLLFFQVAYLKTLSLLAEICLNEEGEAASRLILMMIAHCNAKTTGAASTNTVFSWANGNNLRIKWAVKMPSLCHQTFAWLN